MTNEEAWREAGHCKGRTRLQQHACEGPVAGRPATVRWVCSLVRRRCVHSGSPVSELGGGLQPEALRTSLQPAPRYSGS